MGLMAKSTGGPRVLPPEAVHIGICIGVYDLGTQVSPQFGPNRKVALCWELDAQMTDGKPFTITQQYTLSLHEKASLRALLESWRGRAFTEAQLEGFDIFTVLGAPCQLQVIHNKGGDGQTYANVKTVMPLPKSMKVDTTTENEVRSFSFDEQAPGHVDIPAGTWEWIVKKIQAAPEYKELMEGGGEPDKPGDVTYAEADSDSCPF
jgi:hypothetical protein